MKKNPVIAAGALIAVGFVRNRVFAFHDPAEVAAAPDIKWVARIGAATSDTQGPPRPLYLRQPDAQPQDAARLPRR